MSSDYAVLSLASRLSEQEVASLYESLCDGEVRGVVPSPAIEAFYQEITQMHPEVDDVPEAKLGDHDFSPWSAAFDRSPGHIVICCVWPKANYVAALLLDLATKHGLTIYDPQSGSVFFPPGGRLPFPEPKPAVATKMKSTTEQSKPKPLVDTKRSETKGEQPRPKRKTMGWLLIIFGILWGITVLAAPSSNEDVSTMLGSLVVPAIVIVVGCYFAGFIKKLP